MSLRIYKSGRSTEGYDRGSLLTSLSEVKEGDVLVMVNHRFQAENMIVVASRPADFTPINDGERICFRYFDPQSRAPTGHLMSVWGFELSPAPLGTDLYRAEKQKSAE